MYVIIRIRNPKTLFQFLASGWFRDSGLQVGGQGFRGYKGMRALGLRFQGLGGSGFRAWGLPALTGCRVFGFRVCIKSLAVFQGLFCDFAIRRLCGFGGGGEGGAGYRIHYWNSETPA